jgi:RNA polymerase sigma factor (sigma-70 family)
VDLNDPTFVQGLVSGNLQNLDEFRKEFYSRFRSKSLKHLSRLGIREGIEDQAHALAVDAILEINKYRRSFAGKSGEHIRNYCYKTYRTIYKKYIGKLKEEGKLLPLDDKSTPPIVVNNQLSIEQSVDIDRALRELGEMGLLVIRLRFIEEYNVADTAMKTGLTKENVRTVSLRGKRKIKAFLEGTKEPSEGK